MSGTSQAWLEQQATVAELCARDLRRAGEAEAVGNWRMASFHLNDARIGCQRILEHTDKARDTYDYKARQDILAEREVKR